MIGKKDSIAAFLVGCWVMALLFAMPLTRSASEPVYDPWTDLNDDGAIDSTDLGMLGGAWGSFGTPINKTQMLLDLQNRVNTLEERQDYVKTIRFYTPNETMTDQWDWKDAAVFVWTPQNATDNAILHGAVYFKYRFPSSPYNQIGFRVLINEYEVIVNYDLGGYTPEYTQTVLYGFGSSRTEMPTQETYPIKCNQDTYIIRFQIGYLGPSYVKDINILLEVIDGLPPS